MDAALHEIHHCWLSASLRKGVNESSRALLSLSASFRVQSRLLYSSSLIVRRTFTLHIPIVIALPDITMAPSKCIVCKTPNGKCCITCKSAKYCSTKCQKLDWPLHKLLCKRFATYGELPSVSRRSLWFDDKVGTPLLMCVPISDAGKSWPHKDCGVPELRPFYVKEGATGVLMQRPGGCWSFACYLWVF